MKPVSPSEINRFVELTTLACYNDYNKQEYRKLGRRILKWIVDQLGLQTGEFDIHWNPGGVACSGDHRLNTDKFHLCCDDNLGRGWFYWRTTKGRKDYTGGQNQIVRWELLLKQGLTPLVEQLRICQSSQWKDPVSGDVILNINQAIRMAVGK